MCDEAKYHDLDDRLDKLETRQSVLETKVDGLAAQMDSGFSRLETTMRDILGERKAWGQWMRQNLPTFGKCIAKWGGGIILLGYGINNLGSIVKALKGGAL